MWNLKSNVIDNWAWIDVLENEEITKLFELSKSIDEEPGTASKDNNGSIRNSNIKWLYAKDANFHWLYAKLTDAVNYANDNFFQLDLTYIEDLQFTIYDASLGKQRYGKHIDTRYNSPGLPRKLSFSILLSDPEEFEGGDLVIHDGYNPSVVDRVKGRATFFPSYTLHEVTPVTSGVRYSLVGWVHGPKLR